MSDRFEGIYGSEPDGSRDGKPELIAEHSPARSDPRPTTPSWWAIAATMSRARTPINLRAIGVLWGYGDRQELEAAGADLLVAAPSGPPSGLASLSGFAPR